MSHPGGDKYGTFKLTATNTFKRTSNESHDSSDESKKLRLEKSGSSSNILATNAKSSGGVVENSSKTYSTSTGSDEMILVRKQVALKTSDTNDMGVEDRIIHIEGDPGGTAGTGYLSAMSSKSQPKRLQIGMVETTKKSFGEGIDLKLFTAANVDAQSVSGKFSVLSQGEKKSEQQQQILLTASSSSINPQNTFTYSRVCSVSNVSGQSGDTVSLKSLQGGTVKNQSLMVSSKKLLPEVTQTTAKVSIGNTTISVPLLKPLNSSQIIHQAGGNTSSQSGQSEGTKSVIHTIQTSSNQSPQAQLSKILNIKRGQKVSQPTFVSLSQLQIKPVSSAKLVQTKVVSKKIPLQFQTVQANKSTLLQQTSGVVTITSTKSELQQTAQHQQQTLTPPPTAIQGHTPSPQKKQQLNFVKDLPQGAIIKSSSSLNAEEMISSSHVPVVSTTASDQQHPNTTEKTQMLKSTSGCDNLGTSIISTDFLPANVKVVHTSTASSLNSASMRPTLTSTHNENVEQNQTQSTQRINICPTISIVRQNSPQLVTTSNNLSTVSLSMADAVSGQQKLILTKSQFANVSSSSNSSTSTSNTVTTNFPRNISLMLAKASTGQQVFTNAGSKTTLCVTTSAPGNNSSSNKTNAPARMNLSINPSLLSSSSNATPGSQNDTDTSGTSDAGATPQETTNVQHQQVHPAQQIQTNLVQNRKIIQVLPGGLYSSSGGSFVQISKPKADSEEEKKKIGDMEHQAPQIHLQIQQSQTTHQSPQLQSHHQLQIQQISQQRQQITKHQIQQQLQKHQFQVSYHGLFYIYINFWGYFFFHNLLFEYIVDLREFGHYFQYPHKVVHHCFVTLQLVLVQCVLFPLSC